jgi:NAD(P)H:quinone oxidoreductase type IV
MTKVAVIYYSATGNVHALAEAVAQGAAEAGAQVRLRRVAELAPEEAIDSNPAWRAHVDATDDIPVATNDDLRWADGVVFGSPTRFGNISAQLKQFLDRTGPLWAAGELADKVATGFTSTGNPHGGNESSCSRSTTRSTTGVRSLSRRAIPTSRSPRREATHMEPRTPRRAGRQEPRCSRPLAIRGAALPRSPS